MLLAHPVSLLLDVFAIRQYSDRHEELQILLLRQQARIPQRQHPQKPNISRWEQLALAVLDEIRAEGFEVLDEDVKHISPERYEHINPLSKYHINMEKELGRLDLRSLRNHSSSSCPPELGRR